MGMNNPMKRAKQPKRKANKYGRYSGLGVPARSNAYYAILEQGIENAKRIREATK